MLLSPACHGIVDAVACELVASMFGLIGTVVVVIVGALGPGTANRLLRPRLPISVDPKGIPTPRPEPPALDVGVDEAARFVAPEPHMPERPEVPVMAVVVGNPDVAEPDIASDVAMLAGALAAGESPPPS
jgi:hypothetical protein